MNHPTEAEEKAIFDRATEKPSKVKEEVFIQLKERLNRRIPACRGGQDDDPV